MNKWNIIAPPNYINQIKKSEYFSKDLGQSLTVHDTQGVNGRKLRDKAFTSWYYNKYKSLLFKSGNIGLLNFFIDYYLKKDLIGFFLDDNMEDHQYAVEWDQKRIDEIGINAWMGEKLKEVDDTIENIIDNKNNNEGDKGDPNKIYSNPGSVSWKDIEEFFRNKNKK